MGIFSDIKSEGLEQTEDRVGGFSPFDTDFYLATIKVAYAGRAASGARSVSFVFDIGGKEYRETIYVTSRKGENFFLNKDDKTKKVPLPGYTVVNDICLMTTDKELHEQADEDKVINLYDFDQRREVPTSVPMLVELLGKQVGLGIVRNLENKNVKNAAGEYEPTADTRETNNIEKVFHHPTNLTVVEARNELTEPKFHEQWVERNKGNTRDKREIKDGAGGGTSGRPGAVSSGPPAAGGSAPRKSLFGKS